MRFAVAAHALPGLLHAALTTLWVSFAGMLVGQALGLLVCLARGVPWLARPAALYVSFFRGVPLLIQLLLIYDGLPRLGIDVPPLVAAIAGLGLASGAYVSEIFRGALAAVPRGQAEAAVALGFAPAPVWRRILLPQALRVAVPSLVNELILLLKASSLISVIGVSELTRSSHSMAAQTYRPFEIFITAGAIYLAISLALAGLGRLAERRLALG